MDFSLSAEQQLLRDTARRLLADQCPPSLLRAHIDDRNAVQLLWQHLRHFAALGSGECTDLCLFLDELGYAATPGPFLTSVAWFTPLLAAVDHPLLDDAIAGDLVGAVALCGAAGTLVANDEPRKLFCADADLADVFAVVDAQRQLRVVTADDVQLTPIDTVDLTRRVYAIEVAAGATSDRYAIDEAAFAMWVDRAHVTVAAETIGTARRLFDMALQYAKERVQFDRPIGSFQAIQHKLADMSLALERATAAMHYAAMTVDAADRDRARACHSAKAAANEAAQKILKDSIQVHGGIGYTWEHDLHLFLRRATFAATFAGTTSWHHDRIADLLFA